MDDEYNLHLSKNISDKLWDDNPDDEYDPEDIDRILSEELSQNKRKKRKN